MNPYDRLGVPIDADDAMVRRAYLDAVKRHPPERDPERFAALNAAYQTLMDAPSRLEHLLFDSSPGADSPMGVVRSHFRGSDTRKPPDVATLKAFLRRCATR